MLSRLLVIGAFLCVAVSSVAAREGAWTCAYPSYFGKREPIIVTFERHGNLLKEGGIDKYVILQDNDVGLVAAHSFSYMEEEGGYHPGLNLGAFVIMIDKQTMKFRRGNVLMGDPDGAAAYGTCKRG